jgi:beta-glucosidase
VSLPDFLWGVSTSAYQVEGAPENDWTLWERRELLKVRGERCGEASGHGRRWREDFELLPTLGANAYRYSIERSVVEPEPGVFSDAALRLQRDRADALAGLGIEPVVTLHHFTNPVWFQSSGGWENPASVAGFRHYVSAVADALGPRVRVWVTVNEPMVFLLGGYVGGLIPPGLTSFRGAARALEHLLAAHVEAADVLRTKSPGSRVGIAHNMLEFAPDRANSALDRRLTRFGERLYNLALIEAIATERMDWWFPGKGRARFRVPGLAAANQFLGVNYYSRVHIRFRGFTGVVGEFLYRDPESRGLTDTGWEIHPHGFGRVLREAEGAGLPILVTENGVATRDDGVRRTFLREHALVLAQRRADGARIDGYFHWSLIDNFEWLEGFRPRFGLFEVDYATFERRRRPSADLFAQLGTQFTGAAGGESSVVSPG